MWDLATGQPVGQPLRHSNLQVAAFSPDGKQALTGGLDNSVRTWNVASRNKVEEVRLDCVPIEAILSRDAQTVLTWHHGKESASLWEARTGKFLRETVRHPVTLTAAAFSPDGLVIATASNRGLRFEETATGKLRQPEIRLPGHITKLAFSPDGKTLLVIALNGTTWRMHRWETATGKPLGQPWLLGDSARISYIHSVAVGPAGKRVVIAQSDGTAHLRDIATGRLLQPVFRHEGAIWVVSFSPNGRTLITGSLDGTARLWDAATGKPRGLPLQHFSRVWTVGFSPDGRSLLTGSDDGRARLWDLSTGKPIGPPQRLSGPVRAAGFDSSGRRFQGLTWDASRAQPVTILSWTVPPPPETAPERIVLWSGIATGMTLDADGAVQMLNREQWNQARQKLGPSDRPDSR